jgi:hypothetical protein
MGFHGRDGGGSEVCRKARRTQARVHRAFVIDP